MKPGKAMADKRPIEIFMPPNILKAKVGGSIAGLDMAAIQRAEKAVAALQTEFSEAQKKADEAKEKAEKEAAELKEKHDKELAEAKKKAADMEAAKKKAEEEAKSLRPGDDMTKPPIRFKDAVGRKFSFPWHLCKTWKASLRFIISHLELIKLPSPTFPPITLLP